MVRRPQAYKFWAYLVVTFFFSSLGFFSPFLSIQWLAHSFSVSRTLIHYTFWFIQITNISLVSVGGSDKKIPLEQQTHQCPRCRAPSSVKLTRIETQLVVLGKTVGKPGNMRVRYECERCKWKSDKLPEANRGSTDGNTKSLAETEQGSYYYDTNGEYEYLPPEKAF